VYESPNKGQVSKILNISDLKLTVLIFVPRCTNGGKKRDMESDKRANHYKTLYAVITSSTGSSSVLRTQR
jgi:hypothetical protein